MKRGFATRKWRPAVERLVQRLIGRWQREGFWKGSKRVGRVVRDCRGIGQPRNKQRKSAARYKCLYLLQMKFRNVRGKASMCVTTHMSTEGAPEVADGRHFMNLGRGGGWTIRLVSGLTPRHFINDMPLCGWVKRVFDNQNRLHKHTLALQNTSYNFLGTNTTHPFMADRPSIAPHLVLYNKRPEIWMNVRSGIPQGSVLGHTLRQLAKFSSLWSHVCIRRQHHCFLHRLQCSR